MEWIVKEEGERGKGNLQVSGLGNWVIDGAVNSNWECRMEVGRVGGSMFSLEPEG